MQGKFADINAIIRNNKRNDYQFFSPKSMAFWGSSVHDEVYGGCVFVTRDNDFHGNPMYSVRIAMDDGSIHSYAFNEFETSKDAHRKAKQVGMAIVDGMLSWNARSGDFEDSTLLGL